MSDEHLRIHFKRSGGFAGLSTKVSVDTDKLPADVAAELRQLVAEAHLGTPARRGRGSTRVRDAFQYDLVIAQDHTEHHLSLHDADVDPRLRPLLKRLVELARDEAAKA